MAKIGIIPIKYGELKLNDACSVCRAENNINVKLIQNAFLIGFPLFPTSKEQKVECLTCKATLSRASLKPESRLQINKVLKTKKPSPWYYTFGYIVILVMIIALSVSAKRNSQNKEFINNPQLGDLYCIGIKQEGVLSSSTFYYNYYKVARIKGDRLLLVAEDEYEREEETTSSISSQIGSLVWGTDTTVYSKTELLNCNNSFGRDENLLTVYEVYRKE